MLLVRSSRLSIKPMKQSIFARFPSRSGTCMLLARCDLELILLRKTAKTTKSHSDASVFDSRTAFVGNGEHILQRQHDFRKQTLQKQCFSDDTKRALHFDYGKSSIFWFHANDEKWECPQNAHQRHNYEHPNGAISTCYSLVSMPSLFFNNMLESLTRQWIQNSTMFGACKDKLLVHDLCIFLILMLFLQIRQIGKRLWNLHQNNISTLHTRWRPSKCCCGSWLLAKLLLPR